MKRILRKNQIMITALAIMIAVAGYLNFAGAKIGEEDFLSMDGSDSELSYEMADISDEDMYAISLQDEEQTNADITSLDSDIVTQVPNYLSENIQILGDSDDSLAVETGISDTLSAEADVQSEDSQTQLETPGEAVFTSASGVSSLAGAKLLKEQTRARNKETLLEIINNDSLTEAAKQDAVDSMLAMTQTAQRETDAEMLLEAKGFSQTVVSIGEETVDVMVNTASLTDSQTAQIIDIVQRKTLVEPENIVITVSGAN